MEYQLLWLGNRVEVLPADAQVSDLQRVPSLMYLCGLPEVPACAVVLNFLTECPYSITHVLSVARLLSSTPHRLFVLASGTAHKTYFSNREDMVLLPEDAHGALSVISEVMHKREPPQAEPSVHTEQIPVKKSPPLELYGMILILAVAGSQSRIGCTTQTFRIWHYCQSLGLQTAVVMPPNTAALLAKFMDGQPRNGGFEIAGIPVVDGMTYEFDCYVQDLGVLTPDKQKQFQEADCGILVMGGKPWELPGVAQALPVAEAQERLLLLVSFCTDATLEELRKLFPDKTVAAAEWCPDPFQAQAPELDAALRPLLEQAILPDFP